MSEEREKWISVAGAVLIPGLVVLILTALSVNVLRDYGYVLFVLVPVGTGMLSSTIYGFFRLRTWGQSLKISLLTLSVSCLLLLVFAIEGIVCIIMASPMLVFFQLLGTIIGHSIQKTRKKRHVMNVFMFNVLVLPLLMQAEGTSISREGEMIKVSTTIEIEAPIQEVWSQVIAFPEIPEPSDWFFRTGIAYPISSRMVGEKEDAVRYCEFTTGAFVEPITTWEEPHLLQFLVEEMPVPFAQMMSAEVPGNMYQYFVSSKGEFRLSQLENGNTQLVGSTWYYHKIKPIEYWKVWSDFIIHKIHYRVLNHIKFVSEQDSSS